MPADGVVQLAFDRYLLPSTITRQSYVVVDSTNTPLEPALLTTYDPIARTVTIMGPGGPGVAWLTPDQSYKLVLLVASDPKSDLGGFRAIDRAALDPHQRLELVFRAGPLARRRQLEPTVDFCADVLPIFTLKCSSGTCHGASNRAASSLILASSEGVRVTARGRVAQGSNTGPRGSPEPTPSLFGVNMELIKPGDPGASWLMYKVELAPHPAGDAEPAPPVVCTPPSGAHRTAAAGPYATLAPARVNADAIERAILSDYVLGREMPYPPLAPSPEYFYTPLDFQERETIRLWITQGAELRACGTCDVIRNR